jgi:hypothetical protein
MSKANTDYSNTIFYKIYCKDPSITDLYIGHTTNFVQRKHSHKQSCINPNSVNYNYKLYQCIRDNLGWDNWTMEIIGFHNCEDLQSAKVQEQHYFEEYKATLNSVEPSPKRKPKKEINIKPNSVTENRKISMDVKEPSNYVCESCNFISSKHSNYMKHILTAKHKSLINLNEQISNRSYICECGKKYKHMSTLCNHKKKCNRIMVDKDTLIIALLQHNLEFMKFMKESYKLQNIISENNQKMIDEQF